MHALHSNVSRVLALAAGAVGLIALLALALVDAELARRAVGEQLEAAFGERVELGEAEVSLLPRPGARIRGVRIGAAPGLHIEAPELRVGVSLLGLLTGDVVLDSVEVRSPRVRLPTAGARGSAPPRTPPSREHAAPSGQALALERLVVRDGTLEAGVLSLQGVELAGAFDGADRFEVDFSVQGPAGSELADGRLELSGLPGPLDQAHWTAHAQLAVADLAEWRERLGLPALWGRAEGSASAAGRGLALERLALELTGNDLDVRSGSLRLNGPVRFAAELPGSLRLDLTDARLALAPDVEKPEGVALRIEGRASAELFGDLRIDSQAVRATGRLERSPGSLGLALTSGQVDLAALSAWTTPAWLPRKGSLQLASARLQLQPLAAELDATLTGVEVPLREGRVTARVSGPVRASGSAVRGELQIEVAETALTAAVRYDASTERIALRAAVRGSRIDAFAGAFAGRTDLSGALYADVELIGPPDPYALTGAGSFELQDAEIPEISIARFVPFEHTGTEPALLDHIQRLRGRFRVEADRVRFEELVLAQEYATATVQGDLYLQDLSLDMSGQVLLAYPELPAPTVRPLMRLGGTLGALELHISQTDDPNDGTRRMEAAMIEEIRKVEAEQRAARKAGKAWTPSVAAGPEEQAATESGAN